MSVIRLNDVTVRYPDGTTALHAIRLVIERGERVALIGASGSGKTTLARLIFGLIQPASGEVRVFGRRPSGRAMTTPGQRAQLLFQQPSAMLHPALTVRQLLNESARTHRRSAQDVDAILEHVQLTHRHDALPQALSGGERRRAGIARVLMAEPDLLVADEPTTGLDAALKPTIAPLLMAPGRTTLLVTHDLWLAAEYTERMVFVHKGHVIDDVSELRSLSHPHAIALARAAGVAV